MGKRISVTVIGVKSETEKRDAVTAYRSPPIPSASLFLTPYLHVIAPHGVSSSGGGVAFGVSFSQDTAIRLTVKVTVR